MLELFITIGGSEVRIARAAVLRTSRFRTSLVTLLMIFGTTAIATAQTSPQNMPTPPEPINADKSRSSDDKPTLGSMDDEMRVKQSIKLLEKEYKQNVDRAREAAELGAQLRDALKEGRPFGREETKKLERLEKLAKKIRDEAGGSDEDDVIRNPPGKLDSALSRLADIAESLFKAVEKTPRQVISAAVIEKANALLQLARVTKNLFH
jgi:hypothetical protein